MQTKGWTVNTASPNVMKTAPQVGNIPADSLPVFYAFNAEDNKGFVLVSASDRTAPILGYADNASFSIDAVPANMQIWLDGIRKEMEYLEKSDVPIVQAAANYNPAIAPMLTCVWGQDAPYNTQCPKIGNKYCVTGCLATAIAQIIYYHKWPEGATSEIPGYTTYTLQTYLQKLSATTFDWSSMRDRYSKNESAPEVAKLMRYVGQAVHMDYTTDQSGSSEAYLVQCFKNYFGYNSSVRIVNRAYYSISQWDNIIYNELANNRPVCYTGFTPSGSGHAFVCDGYDGKGFYHINWGWDGVSNGYFRLSVLNPDNTSSTGAASTDEGYSVNQVIAIGIQRPGLADNTVPQIWPVYKLSASGSTASVQFSPVISGSHQVCFASLSDDGTLTQLSGTKSYVFSSWTQYTASFNLSGVADGNYTIVPAIRQNGTSDWTRMGSDARYIELSVTSGRISMKLHPVVDLEVSGIDFPNSAGTATQSKVEFTVNNKQDEFDGNLYVFANTEDVVPTTSIGNTKVALMSGESLKTAAYVKMPSVKDVYVWVSADENGANPLAKRRFYSYDLSLDSWSVVNDPLSVTATIKNNSLVAYKGKVRATVYSNKSQKALGSIVSDMTIESNCTGDMVINTLKLPTTDTYYIIYQVETSELSSAFKNLEGRVNIDWTDDISCIPSDVEYGTAHQKLNISGQHVNETYRGIVISDGKKFLQK